MLQDKAELNQGNKIEVVGIIEAQIEQNGCTFEGNITAREEGKIQQGNMINIGRMAP